MAGATIRLTSRSGDIGDRLDLLLRHRPEYCVLGVVLSLGGERPYSEGGRIALQQWLETGHVTSILTRVTPAGMWAEQIDEGPERLYELGALLKSDTALRAEVGDALGARLVDEYLRSMSGPDGLGRALASRLFMITERLLEHTSEPFGRTIVETPAYEVTRHAASVLGVWIGSRLVKAGASLGPADRDQFAALADLQPFFTAFPEAAEAMADSADLWAGTYPWDILELIATMPSALAAAIGDDDLAAGLMPRIIANGHHAIGQWIAGGGGIDARLLSALHEDRTRQDEVVTGFINALAVPKGSIAVQHTAAAAEQLRQNLASLAGMGMAGPAQALWTAMGLAARQTPFLRRDLQLVLDRPLRSPVVEFGDYSMGG